MVPIAVEAVPVGSKLPEVVSVRISEGERHGFGAAAPLSTRAWSLEHGRAGDPVESLPKLVRHISSGSTWFAEQLSSCFAWSAAAFSAVCVCVFSSHSFWTSSSLDVPAGVTQEEGHTGFLIHLLSAVRALIFLARKIQPFLSLVDREVEFCVLTIQSFSTRWSFLFLFLVF